MLICLSPWLKLLTIVFSFTVCNILILHSKNGDNCSQFAAMLKSKVQKPQVADDEEMDPTVNHFFLLLDFQVPVGYNVGLYSLLS